MRDKAELNRFSPSPAGCQKRSTPIIGFLKKLSDDGRAIRAVPNSHLATPNITNLLTTSFISSILLLSHSTHLDIFIFN